MADFSTEGGLDAFLAYKQGQRENAIASGLRGLQFATTGGHFTMTCSTDDFYETVCIGQAPRAEIERYRNPANKREWLIRELPEERKRLKNRAIDLTDTMIDGILEMWANKRSAFDLPFVMAVWGIDGMARSKIP